jgi:patatin-like phospholipase/acyl hydrolase
VENKVIEQWVVTFDGENDYIDFGKNDPDPVLSEGISGFTVSGWINPHHLTRQATTYGTRNVFFARSSDRYSDNFEVGVSPTGNLDIYIDEKFSKFIKTLGNGELTIGKWHFFAIVFNQSDITVYLDHNQYIEYFTGSTLNKATSPITLGGTLHNNIHFSGQLAHISIWNYPCNQEQIKTHRSGLIVGDEEGLVAYWKLDEGEGKIVKNQTGDFYQGNFYGNPNWNLTQIPLLGKSSDQEEIQTENVISSQQEKTTINAVEASVNILSFPSLSTEKLQENKNQTPQPKYKILSIDGGGIRGIIPALVLAEIEKRTQKPIFSLFDLIAGISTGGILALGLTKPRLNKEISDKLTQAEYTAADLSELFIEYGVEIFYEPLFEKLLGPLEDIFLQPKYASTSRVEMLKQYFGDSLIENNLKEVFVTGYDIEQRIPIFFTNKREKEQIESKRVRNLCAGFSLLDAALATSATPTYFPPHRIVTKHNTNGFYTLVDGGVFANNPSQLAISEAKISSKREADRVLNTEDILMVSLGTGSLTSVYPYNKVKNWGLLQWGRPLLNIMFDGSSEVVAGELERLFASSNPETTSSYYRLQTFLDSELEEIDKTTLRNIRQLQVAAQQMISQNSKKIDELCSLLLE